MSVRSRDGRQVPAKQKNNLMPLFVLIGIVAIVGITLLLLSLNQPTATTATPAKSSGNASVDLAALGSYPSKGSASAPVTVVEFADYQCPACASYANGLAAQIDKDYVESGKVRFIYHELPIPSHKNAVTAASAARAAGEQGKYWEMNTLLFARQNDWAGLTSEQAATTFGTYAKELGLNAEPFSQTLASGKYAPIIAQAYEDSSKAGIQFTPSFVINGKIYAAADLKQAIDQALAAK